MATLTERLAIVVEANAGKAIAEFKTLGGATKGLSGDVGKAGGALSKFGGSLGGLLGSAGPGAAAAGIGLAFAKMSAAGVSAFVDLAGQVKEFRRVAGGTAEDASRLVAAFSAVGVDATTAATGVFQLEKHLASGADKLAAFGVTAQKDAKGNTDMKATLLSVGDAYKRIQDPVQRAALLTAAFGRQGTALIPLLGKSGEEIQHFFEEADKHHQILTDDDLKKATEYKLAMHDLGEAFKGLEMEAGKSLVPFITDVAKAITGTIELIDKIDHLLHIQKEGQVAHGGGLGAWIDELIHGSAEADRTALSATDLGTALSDTGNIIAGLTIDTKVADAGMDALDKALSAAATADHALADAHQNTVDAQAALNKLMKDGAVDAKKVADAQRSLADATRSVGHAQREQVDAQQAYNEAAAAADILGTDTAQTKKHEAANKLADANDAVASATESAAAAAADLRAAQAGDPEYQTKLAAAKQKVADATLTESQRALASVTAHEAEATALSDNAAEVQGLIDKYADLIKQHPEVAAALLGNAAALGGANAAAAGLVNGKSPAPAPSAPSASPPRPPGADTGNILATTKTNHVTITVNGGGTVDPQALSRNILWGLN